MDWVILAIALAAVLSFQVIGFRLAYRQPLRLTAKHAPLLVVGGGAIFLGFMIRQVRTKRTPKALSGN